MAVTNHCKYLLCSRISQDLCFQSVEEITYMSTSSYMNRHGYCAGVYANEEKDTHPVIIHVPSCQVASSPGLLAVYDQTESLGMRLATRRWPGNEASHQEMAWE